MPPLLALPFPVIDPVIISVGPLAIRWYAMAYVAGIVGGWLYARHLVQQTRLWQATRRPTSLDLDDLMVWIAAGIVLGGRIGYVLFYNLEAYLAQPAEIFAVWHGGMSFHGGLVGAMLAIVLLARRRGIDPLAFLDLASVVAPLGLLFGRIANFINGELWGRPAPEVPWAMVFPSGGPVPRHPSQLYEAFAEGLVLLVVMGVLVRILGFRRPGLLTGIFAIGYAIARIACEFFREPDAQLGFLFGTGMDGGGLTMGMLLSLPLAAAGAAVIRHALRRRQPAAGAAS